MTLEMPEEGATFRIETLGALLRKRSKTCKYSCTYPFLTSGKLKLKTRLRFACDKQGDLCVSLTVAHCDASHAGPISVSLYTWGRIRNTGTGEYYPLWNLETPLTQVPQEGTLEFPIALKLVLSSSDRHTRVTINRLVTTGFVRNDQLVLQWKVEVSTSVQLDPSRQTEVADA